MTGKFRRSRLAVTIALLAGLTACGSNPGRIPPSGSLVPDEGKLQVTSDISYTYKEAVAAPVTLVALSGILEKSLDQLLPFSQPILLYFVYQPFAPNWSVEEARLNERTYYVRLLAKRFRTGGDGEAMQVLKRRAQQLQYEHGYTAYRILDYSEGIESGTPLAQRYSHGLIELVRNDQPLAGRPAESPNPR